MTSAYGEATPDVTTARALPGAAYADPAVFEAEAARLFPSAWLPVARESEVAKPGDYRAIDLAGVPLVVTRDAAGAVHVLSRVCRHRGMPVVEGCGNAKALTCPYHLWRYHLDGRLAAAPAMEGSQVFDRHASRLPAVAHERWGGWIFANLDGKAAPLGPRLEALSARLGPLDPTDLVTAGVIELDSPWNWKVMVENFLESYHHIGAHAGSLQHTNPGLGTHEGVAGEAFTVLENPAAGGHAPFVVAAIFPLTLMYLNEGEMRLGLWYELDQVRHAAFRLRVHLLVTPEFAAVPEAVAQFREQVMAVHLEDIPVCEGVQKGVTSQHYQPGPLSRLESTLWRFHSYLRRAAAAG